VAGNGFGFQVVSNLTPRCNAADEKNFSCNRKISFGPGRYNILIEAKVDGR